MRKESNHVTAEHQGSMKAGSKNRKEEQINRKTKNSQQNGNISASLVAQMEKNLPAVQEIWVQSLGQEDPLEKGMAVHSSILAWRIP